MKIIVTLCVAAWLSFMAAVGAHAGILAGPIANPANGHDYFLLTANTWSASEAEAETLGGTLAVIKSEAEQQWVFSQFSNYGGTNRNLWIGLRRQWPGGPFTWVTDQQLVYLDWCDGEPNNHGGMENCVHIISPTIPYPGAIPGKWNDLPDAGTLVDGTVPFGVVEVPGKANEAALTSREQSLIGDWYNNGDPQQPCTIAGTTNRLFAIDQNHEVSRIIDTPEGFLFSPRWKQHMILMEDKILWSRGNWWSRQPMPFKLAADKEHEAQR
jgi:hypothetical protein